jgi:tol-pal system protein YbgF
MTPRWLARLAPLAAVAAAGCFATRNDVRVVQQDIATLRTESARRDSARAVQDARLLTALQQSIDETRDSIRSVSTQLGRHNADNREEMYAIGQQVIQLLAMQGLSQQRLQEMRAALEERAATVPPPAVAPPTGTMTGRDSVAAEAVSTEPAAPGPNQLYQLANEQMKRGSFSTARAGFGELLRLYPESDLAAESQFQIALAFGSEGQDASADSAYALVVTKYPQSPRAPTSLYKRGVALAAAGQTRLARQLLTQLIDTYPRADEVELARDRLRTLPPTS